MLSVRTRVTTLATIVSLTLALVATVPATAGSTAVRAETAERYALSLLNCTRTGGKVTADGTCVGRGSGKYSAYRKPLRLHKKISNKVAWPWAKALALQDVCGHTIAGKPSLATRLRNNGFKYPYFGENVGCGVNSAPKSVVLLTHRLMQAEQQSRGGHWLNMKNPEYKSVGISVARVGKRVRVVFEFYGKRY